MTLRPTNLYRRIGQEFAYSIDTQLDAASLRRALNRVAIGRGLQNPDATVFNFGINERCNNFVDNSDYWTAVLPLGLDFGPEDVAVKLDDKGVFSVFGEAASNWQDGDFVRFIRHIQLPVDELNMDSVRCWIEENCLVLQAERREVKTVAVATPTGKKHHHQQQEAPLSLRNAWPRSSLTDTKQRQGCLTKDKKTGTKWTLDLAVPEFQPDEVSITTIKKSDEGSEATNARLLITASYCSSDPSSLSGDSKIRHEYRREVTPPSGVPLDQVVASFLGNGILRLSAPLPPGAVKSRRTIVGLVGGSAGGAGAKIASLTRELRHVGTQRRQQQQQAGAAGSSASLPRPTTSSSAGAAAAAPGASAESASAAAGTEGRGATRSGENRSCAVQ